MNCSVNLLPQSCHDARQRRGRCRLWAAIAAGACVAALGGWIVQQITDQHRAQLVEELRGVEITQSELERQLLLAVKTRNDLVTHGRALTALRHNQVLADQVYAMATALPGGVVFTEIQALPAVVASPAGRQPAGEGSVGVQSLAGAGPVMHLSGFATNQDELTALIDALQRTQYWQRVELLRASRAPFQQGVALAFRLECLPAEDGK